MDEMEKQNHGNDKRSGDKYTWGRTATVVVSLLAAVVSATELHGWHVYVGLAIVAVGLCIALLASKHKHASADLSSK
jgi:hypothetical protein